jgi:integrase
MPRHTGLLRRGSRYYLNVRVPKDLREAFGKECIRESLATSDPHEAARLVRFKGFKLDTQFTDMRRKLSAAEHAKTERENRLKRVSLTDQEAHELVCKFLISMEKLSEDWWEKTGKNLSPEMRSETLDTLRMDSTAYDGGSVNVEAATAEPLLENFLKKEGLDCPKESAAYQKLLPLFRVATLENVRRDLAQIEGGLREAREPRFAAVHSHTELAPRTRVTLGQMLTRFRKAQTDAKRTEGTMRTYEIPARILGEFFGTDSPLDAITAEEIERLFDVLRRAPANATKRYRGMRLEKAIEAADKKNDPHRLGAKTLENYFNNTVAIFNFAVEKRLLPVNPAKDRYLRAAFETDDDDKPKVIFTIDELNRLFRAPLYTGCKNDEFGYTVPGNNHPRRGRFWVPLLALFHGFRCNEAVQLYTEDIVEVDGIPCIEIRERRRDGSASDKRLKTRQSNRRVARLWSEAWATGLRRTEDLQNYVAGRLSIQPEDVDFPDADTFEDFPFKG